MKNTIYVVIAFAMIVAPLAQAAEKSAMQQAVDMKKQDVEELQEEYSSQKLSTGITLPIAAGIAVVSAIGAKKAYKSYRNPGATMMPLLPEMTGIAGMAAAGAVGGGAVITGAISASNYKRAGDRLEHGQADLQKLEELQSSDISSVGGAQ